MLDADGYKLDTNHDTPMEVDDLPDLVKVFLERNKRWAAWQRRSPDVSWSEKWWFATSEELASAD